MSMYIIINILRIILFLDSIGSIINNNFNCIQNFYWFIIIIIVDCLFKLAIYTSNSIITLIDLIMFSASFGILWNHYECLLSENEYLFVYIITLLITYGAIISIYIVNLIISYLIDKYELCNNENFYTPQTTYYATDV